MSMQGPTPPTGPQPRGQRTRGRSRGRQQSQPITLEALKAAALPLTEPRHWLTQDWRLRRAVRLHRLGQWVAMTRARLQLTSREIEQLALRDGEPASSTLFLRVEHLRLADQITAEDARERVSLTAMDWLATLAGQTLSDVDRYLRGGDISDLEPDMQTRADTVRSAFLSLSPARQQALEEFAQHLYHLEELDQRALTFPSSRVDRTDRVDRTGYVAPALPPAATASDQADEVEQADEVGAFDASQTSQVNDADDAERAGRAAQREVLSARAELEQARARVRDLEAAEGHPGEGRRLARPDATRGDDDQERTDRRPPRRKSSH